MIYDPYVVELHIESPFITIYQRSLLLRNGVYVSWDSSERWGVEELWGFRSTEGRLGENMWGFYSVCGIWESQHIKIYITIFHNPVDSSDFFTLMENIFSVKQTSIEKFIRFARDIWNTIFTGIKCYAGHSSSPYISHRFRNWYIFLFWYKVLVTLKM